MELPQEEEELSRAIELSIRGEDTGRGGNRPLELTSHLKGREWDLCFCQPHE